MTTALRFCRSVADSMGQGLYSEPNLAKTAVSSESAFITKSIAEDVLPSLHPAHPTVCAS